MGSFSFLRLGLLASCFLVSSSSAKVPSSRYPVLDSTSVSISLNGNTALHTFDGHGALSAGASSRLLWDYPEPQRTQILDFLFKPNFGANLAILKVEIGGDGASTNGDEPSHEHFRGDLSCTRGYEVWLVQQARARNPNIRTYGLSWAAPAFIGNGTFYSAENIAYQTQFVKCIAQEANGPVDYIGIWNERGQPDGTDYIVDLRQSLDAAGFTNTKIIVMDGGLDTNEVQNAQVNETFRNAIYGAGLHYPCDKPAPEVRDLGWDFWASEDYSRDPSWLDGGSYWGKALSQNYVLMNLTATIAWSLIWSTYTNGVCNGAGLMRAHQPWSGNYEASAPIWLSAHWGQFVQPGWKFLTVPGGGSGFLYAAGETSNPAGTYVTLVPPTGPQDGVTIIIETLMNNDCVTRNYSNFNLTFTLSGNLPGPGTVLHMWVTTSTAYFVQYPDIIIASDNTVNVLVDADSMVTLSTTDGAMHGTFPGDIPTAAPFPLPYSDNFNNYSYDTLATYFADQGGSFSVRNGTLTQVAQADPGPNGWAPNPDPISLIGDENWIDYALAVDVSFSALIPGGPLDFEYTLPTVVSDPIVPKLRSFERSYERIQQYRQGQGLERATREEVRSMVQKLLNEDTLMAKCDSSDVAQSWQFNVPSPGYLSNTVGYNQLCLNINGCQPDSIIYYQCVNDPNGSSCGAPNGQYPNLVWNLTSQGALLSPMDNWALTLNTTDMQTLYMAPFNNTVNQVWNYNVTSGLIGIPGYNLCLSTPPRKVYAQICGRITSYNGFDATEPMNGYCFQINEQGIWSLVSNGKVLSTGNSTSSGFDPTKVHRIGVSMAGPVISGYFNDVLITEVIDNGYTYGNAAIGSGWHESFFDNFNVTVPYPETVRRREDTLFHGK